MRRAHNSEIMYFVAFIEILDWLFFCFAGLIDLQLLIPTWYISTAGHACVQKVRLFNRSATQVRGVNNLANTHMLPPVMIG
jgi:hypothetical protein